MFRNTKTEVVEATIVPEPLPIPAFCASSNDLSVHISRALDEEDELEYLGSVTSSSAPCIGRSGLALLHKHPGSQRKAQTLATPVTHPGVRRDLVASFNGTEYSGIYTTLHHRRSPPLLRLSPQNSLASTYVYALHSYRSWWPCILLYVSSCTVNKTHC